MKTMLVFLWALVGCSLTVAQTTNPIVVKSDLLPSKATEMLPSHNELQPLRLRLEDPAPAESTSLTIRSPKTNAPIAVLAEKSAANAAFAGGAFTSITDHQLFRMLDESGYLTPQFARDSAIQRAIEAIWEPEVFSFDKVKVSCPVATAVKRKDPLCLLTTLFFNLNW